MRKRYHRPPQKIPNVSGSSGANRAIAGSTSNARRMRASRPAATRPAVSRTVAVVIENSHFVVRKRNDQELIDWVVGVAPRRAVQRRRVRPPRRGDGRRRYTAHRALSNAVASCVRLRFASSDTPDGMQHVVRTDRFHVGATVANWPHQCVQRIVGAIGAQHWPGLRVEVAMLRTRSFSLSGRVSSCLRTRFASYAATDATHATPVCT